MTISKARRIGDQSVSAIGLGAAGFSVGPHPPETDSIATVLAALEAGVRLIDSATCYVPSHEAPGHNEAIIAKALGQWGGDPDEVLVASKAGIERIASGGGLDTDFRTAATPTDIRRHCEVSLRALGVDALGLYQLHSPDGVASFLDTMAAFGALQAEGKIRHVGLSNVTVEQLDEARTVVDVASVQNSFSPGNRDSADVLARCEELGIAFLAYSPLGGLGERARNLPDQNPAFAEVAAARGVSPHRVALAWELALSPSMLPIPGARRAVTIEDSAAAMDLDLSADELAALGPAR